MRAEDPEQDDSHHLAWDGSMGRACKGRSEMGGEDHLGKGGWAVDCPLSTGRRYLYAVGHLGGICECQASAGRRAVGCM